MKHMKLVIVAASVALVVVFAYLQAKPYVKKENVTPIDPGRKTQIRTLENVVDHHFDEEQLKHGAQELRDALLQSGLAALGSLPPNQRPDDHGIQAISAMFADYIILCRTGRYADYADWALSQGSEPIRPTSLTADKEDLYWQEGTAWARAERPDPATVTARTLFVRGQPQHGQFDTVFNSAGPTRELRSGGFLFTSPHDRSAVELSLVAVAPSVDGKTKQPVRIGVVFVNDNPDGSWKPMMVLSRDVPANFILFLPPT
jgi:hypothetical protein